MSGHDLNKSTALPPADLLVDCGQSVVAGWTATRLAPLLAQVDAAERMAQALHALTANYHRAVNDPDGELKLNGPNDQGLAALAAWEAAKLKLLAIRDMNAQDDLGGLGPRVTLAPTP